MEEDFIFGTLATDKLRREQADMLRGGVTHNHRRNPQDPLPSQSVQIAMTVGPAHPCDRAWVYWTTDGSDPSGALGQPSNGFCVPMEKTGVEWDTVLWGYVSSFRAMIPGQVDGTLVRYRLSGYGPGCGELFADSGQYDAYFVSDDPTPDWAKEAVIYQIFVDRFNPGPKKTWKTPKSLEGFFGGTLAGITEKLDYIASVGFNCLWLSPIFASPSHHGYDATDLFKIEPRYGSEADLKRLLDGAHQRGMRVLLDFVPNHWSDEHATFQDAIKNPESIYRNWYNFRKWPTDYETFFGVKTLPQVNLRNPQARQYMLDAARHWLEFGVDGYRLDYALGPTPDFWADFRRATRSARPDCWTFGEVVDPPDVQRTYAGLLDGCLDFGLLEALRQTFAFQRWDGVRLAAFLDRHEANFPADFSRPSFLDNHDMNRFGIMVANDWERLKLAALCQFMLPGEPIVYYGTEVGIIQPKFVQDGGLVASRTKMPWGAEQNQDLQDYYTRLIHLRCARPELSRGTRQTFFADADGFGFVRAYHDQRSCILINLSAASKSFQLPAGFTEMRFTSRPSSLYRIEPGKIQMPAASGVVIV